MLIGMVIVIFWEVFHKKMFWKLVLLMNFVGRFSVSILDPTLFLIYINELPDDVICNIAIYAGDTNLYSRGMIRHHSISPPPFCWGANFSPKFWKGGDGKKWEDICMGELTMFLVKKRLKNKTWLGQLNFKCRS